MGPLRPRTPSCHLKDSCGHTLSVNIWVFCKECPPTFRTSRTGFRNGYGPRSLLGHVGGERYAEEVEDLLLQGGEFRLK